VADPSITDWIGAVGVIATALALVLTAVAIVVTQRNRAEDRVRTEAVNLRQELRRSTQTGSRPPARRRRWLRFVPALRSCPARDRAPSAGRAVGGGPPPSPARGAYVKVKLVAGGWDAAPLLRSSTEQAVLLRHGDVALPGRLRALSTAGRQISALVIGTYSLDAAVQGFARVLEANEDDLIAAARDLDHARPLTPGPGRATGKQRPSAADGARPRRSSCGWSARRRGDGHLAVGAARPGVERAPGRHGAPGRCVDRPRRPCPRRGVPDREHGRRAAGDLHRRGARLPGRHADCAGRRDAARPSAARLHGQCGDARPVRRPTRARDHARAIRRRAARLFLRRASFCWGPGSDRALD
jgi:hypothetical protein